MTRQSALDLACALLQMNASATDGLHADGMAMAAASMLYRTGVTIIDNDGVPWRPSPDHMQPGTATFDAVRKADAEGKARFTADDVDSLASAAISDPVARRACCDLAERLLAQGDAAPGGLFPKETVRRYGPNPAGKQVRNAQIITAVWMLRESGLHLYESEASFTGMSACAITSEALICLGCSLTYDGVRKIWERSPIG